MSDDLFEMLFANGRLVGGREVTDFAAGGVVSSPTVFQMARGIGLMGEAGSEAIMTLIRGSDGKLGVKTTGSSNGEKLIGNTIRSNRSALS